MSLAKLSVGDRVVILRTPNKEEDPDDVWIAEFEELVNYHGTILPDDCPLAPESLYAYIEVDSHCDFYLPTAVLAKLET